jgi:hypothetical protein
MIIKMKTVGLYKLRYKIASMNTLFGPLQSTLRGAGDLSLSSNIPGSRFNY